MRLRQIYEDGRIVKGVNTTVDVGPDEIKKQAAKFGNTVDKDGRPPTLSKKVKGKSTNVLFNLGLSEGVTPADLDKPTPTIHMLARKWRVSPKDILTQLKKGVKVEAEHTTDFDIAMEIALDHINEDPKYYDKLKFVEADSLGEIASSSQIYVDMDGVLADFFTEWGKLMGKDNWRDIGIEQIPAALEKIRQTENFWLDLPLTKNAKNLLNLIKDVKGEYSICSSPLPGDPNSEPHKLEWIKKNLNFFPPKDIIITHDKAKYATTQDGTPNILIDDYGKNIQQWEAAGGVGFKHKDHKFERTAKELKQHMNEPASEDAPPGREKQVKKLKKKFDDPGAPYAIAWAQHNKHGKPNKKESVQDILSTENFADGKEKGKSRPGRVKRAGASCNGSVTELRRKAKNASGERAKMYHWCANMKSGRA